MLRRLHNLSKQYLRSEKPDFDGYLPERPFANLGGKSNNSVDDNLKNSTRKIKRRKVVSTCLLLCYL